MKKIIVNTILALVALVALYMLVFSNWTVISNLSTCGYILALAIAFLALIDSGIEIINALPFEED